jgi:hypothetical protein
MRESVFCARQRPMKIQNLRTETNGDRKRAVGTVVWEDSDRSTYELYFETEEEFAQSLSCNPHAFLVGCIVPAMHYGEKRVAIDAEICPELRQGLITAMSWLRHWYYAPNRPLVRIETRIQSSPSVRPPRAGFFFSGGVDSFATLRQNHLAFPAKHPGLIKDGLLVFGLELDDPTAFQYVKEMLLPVAEQAGFTLIPVYTNVYLNYRSEDVTNRFDFWTHEFQGSAFASIAHAFARRLSVVSIAASYDIPTLELANRQDLPPYGTHPLLDQNYSSGDLRLRHDGIELSRLEKTRLLVEWDVALQNLRVCNRFARYRRGNLNCGRCEKCVRTMLGLLTFGALGGTRLFPADDVSAGLILTAVKSMPDDTMEGYYREVMAALAKKARPDLVHAIRQVIARHHRKAWRMKLTSLENLGRLKRLIASFRT